MSRVISILVVLAVALAITAGCGKVVEKAVEKATGVEVDKDGESVSVDGMTVSQKVPDDVKDLAPSGLQVQDGGTISQGGDKLSVATWKGKSTVDKVIEFYKNTLPGKGWKEASAITSGDTALLMYTKDPDQSLTITITGKSGGEVEVSVMLGKSTQRSTPTAQPTRPASTSAPTPTPAPSRPQATPTPQAPTTTDSTAVPQEMRTLPVMPNFQVVKGTTERLVVGGKFLNATATWFGRGKVKDVVDFYKNNLPGRGWTEDTIMVGETEATAIFTNTKDSYYLAIYIEQKDAGIEVVVVLEKTS